MRLKPICSVICVGAVLLAEGSHALYAPAEDRHPAIVRGESLRPAYVPVVDLLEPVIGHSRVFAVLSGSSAGKPPFLDVTKP
jgi:hypothetical protein